MCTLKTLKKCPLCEFVTHLSVTKHLKVVHKINITTPYQTFKDKMNNENGSRYYYDVGNEKIKEIEIIPSIRNLNKRECFRIDKRNREKRNMAVAKTKLVKKGKEWVVEREKIKMSDYLIPKFDEKQIEQLKKGSESDYIERLKKLYRTAKNNGVHILFPCDSCDKICQTLCALKLHRRKHQDNPKPFAPKIWKHKMKAPQIQEEPVVNTANRFAKPQPVRNKHKCDKQLIEFYENNIKGGDIEFWQFLKIYNKMGRENVNDFKDLENRPEFGIHFEEQSQNVPENKSRIKKIKRRDAFVRVVRLSRKEVERRNEIKKKLREKIQHNIV